MNADIVVIGGGGSGLAAAVASAERGADVIVLEKRRVFGGNSALAEGLLAAESPVQKRLLIDARRDEVFRIAMDYSHWTINPRIVRAFVDKSGDTVRWLEDKGLHFDSVPNFYPNQRIRTWHCIEGRGIVLINLLLKHCERLHVRLHRETGAKKLLKDKKGEIDGVLAENNGREIEISAKAIIIATGGYGGNRELIKKYCPYYTENMVLGGIPNQGDGLLMAMEVGADTEGLGLLHLSGHASPRLSEHINATVGEPNSIWLNKKGERFIGETVTFNRFESVNTVVRQPEGICYVIYDDRIKQNIMEKGIIKGLGQVIKPGTKLPDLDDKLKRAAKEEKEWVKISNSWGDIARWMGIKPEKLKETIDEYNSFCDRRYDGIFAKDPRYLEALRNPPYYAIKCYPRYIGTIGGIKINHKMEVLDKQGIPIPGLYAVGIDTGGWEGDTYNAVLSGTTFGFAINSGRIAGENAVEYIAKK